MTFEGWMRAALPVFAVAAILVVTPDVALAETPAAPVTALFQGSQMIVRDRISVEVTGQGPDLILIPGLSSSRATWRAAAERLKAHYRLHLVQVAGFAGEPARGNAEPGEVVVPTAEAIHAYIAEAHLAPATVIGHSLGGTMGLYVAEEHPADIRRLLAVDSLPFLGVAYGGLNATRQSIQKMIEDWRTGAVPYTQAQNDQMLAMMATAPADVATIKAWQAASDRSVTTRALFEDMALDLRPKLSAITAQVTLLYPDFLYPGLTPEAWKAMHDNAYAPVPNHTVVEIEQSRHFIMFDQPEKFATALDAFLAAP